MTPHTAYFVRTRSVLPLTVNRPPLTTHDDPPAPPIDLRVVKGWNLVPVVSQDIHVPYGIAADEYFGGLRDGARPGWVKALTFDQLTRRRVGVAPGQYVAVSAAAAPTLAPAKSSPRRTWRRVRSHAKRAPTTSAHRQTRSYPAISWVSSMALTASFSTPPSLLAAGTGCTPPWTGESSHRSCFGNTSGWRTVSRIHRWPIGATAQEVFGLLYGDKGQGSDRRLLVGLHWPWARRDSNFQGAPS